MHDYDTSPCTELRPGDAAHMMVAIVLLTYRQGSLQVLMIEDQREPFDGQMSLPWCYVREDQRIDQAARDLLLHELPMGDQDLEQIYTFSCPDRDPRARVMCCSYLGAAPPAEFEWMSVENDRMMIEVRLDEHNDLLISAES